MFKSACQGSGNLKFTSMLVARLMVWRILGCRSFLGALFLMKCALAYVTFWFCCCRMSSEKNCLNKNRLWRRGDVYTQCACLFGDKKMLQRYVLGGSVLKLCLLQMRAEACIWKQTVYTLFCFFMMLKGDLILSSFQEGREFFCCVTSS